MTLSNRKLVEEVLPKTFARVIYQGDEGVIAAVPDTDSLARLAGAETGDPGNVSGADPVTLYLPFKADLDHSEIHIGHARKCENYGRHVGPLLQAAFASSKEAALFLLNFGGLISEDISPAAYDDPAFCKRAVEIYGPRIQCVPLQNLTAELYVQAFSEGEELNDLEEGNIPVLPLADPKLARELFSHDLSGDAMDGLKEAFARHAPVFAEAARTTDWAEVVPAELWESTPAIRAAVRKLG